MIVELVEIVFVFEGLPPDRLIGGEAEELVIVVEDDPDRHERNWYRGSAGRDDSPTVRCTTVSIDR